MVEKEPLPQDSSAQSPIPGNEADVEDYGADKIKVLEGLEAVRLRPAMYIGSRAADGLHHLLYEVVDNSVDEALNGFCTCIEVTIHIDNSITVIDNGRGIPTDFYEQTQKSAAEVVMTTLHAGGKFDNASYKVSGGLHGVGVSCVNALAETCAVEVLRDGKIYTQDYVRGVPTAPMKTRAADKKALGSGTLVRFKPDSQIFET